MEVTIFYDSKKVLRKISCQKRMVEHKIVKFTDSSYIKSQLITSLNAYLKHHFGNHYMYNVVY